MSAAPLGFTLRFRFAVNASGKDKNWDFELLATRYKDTEGTIEDVKRHVAQGHALCAGLLGGKRRSKANVIGSQWLLLDIDNSAVQKDESGQPIKGEDGKPIKLYDPHLTLEDALAHPFIQQYCALIYTTASHRLDWHKFRLVFLLPEYVEGADAIEACTRFLMQHLPHDPACKDASRVFYGNSKAEFPLVQPNATLPLDWVMQARETAQRERTEHAEQVRRFEERKREIRSRANEEGWDTNELIQQALSYIPPRSLGSGNYQECLQVLMALYAHYGPEAEAVAESWSPSIKGSTWNIDRKIRSFRGGRTNGISIGTLFHIAKQYGFKFPKREFTPYARIQQADVDFYSKRAEVIETSGRDQEIIEQAQISFDRLKKLISRAIANPIQYVAPKIKRRIKVPKTITYVPGTLPSPEEYKALGEPKIHFDPSQRVQVWQEAVTKGWKDILDNSHPGLGKSYVAGELIPTDFGVDKLIYQDANHRNPSVATVEENFVDLPVRNNGFKIDTTRQTASGQKYKVWTKPGETPDTDGNCHRTYLFNAFRAKNFSALEFEDSSESPICAGCSLSQQCKFSAGPGYGFRMQKRKAIQDSDRLRAHPDSTPSILFGKGEKVFTVGRIWEEAGKLLDSIKSVEVTLEDFNETVGHLALKLPEEFEKLRPVFEVLRSFLFQELKPDSRYGFDDSSIRGKLPAYPQDLDIAGIKAALSPDLEFLAEKDGIVSNKTERTNALRYAAREIEKQGAREAGREFLGLRLYWLPDFLEAWSGGGSLRCSWGKLNVYTPNAKHKELADSAHFNIYLDATLAPSLLKMKLGVDGPVLLLEQQTPSYDNLKIIHVTGLGQLGKDRSPSCTERVNALKEKLSERHSDLGILDWKAIASQSERTEYGHFVDGRGVNRFEGNSAIAAFGVPYSNVGTLASEYQIMTGRTVKLDQEDGDFQEYIAELVNAEIIQEIGRLRAHRRPGETLVFYFCGDYDTDFLKEAFPGATVEQIDAFTITPDAGSAGQQSRWGILQAVKHLVESGQKITQQAIAKIGEISQPLVSKVSSQFGGWGTLKKLLLTLLDGLNSVSNNFSDQLDSEQQGVVDRYLPLLGDSSQVSGAEAAEALSEIVEAYGETVFEQMLLSIPRRVRLQLISQMLLAAPEVILPTTLEFDYFAQIAAIAS